METADQVIQEKIVREGRRKADAGYPYAELSVFDDLCSSLLLDTMFLGFETHKFMHSALQETDGILENSQNIENIVQESLDSLEIDNSLKEKVIAQETDSSIQFLQENHELEQETRHENVIENQTMQAFETLNGNDLEENGLKESRDADQAEELEKKVQREELALIPDDSIYESLTSSEALAVILTFFIRNNILTKKEVEDSANQLIQILKDPLVLNELKTRDSSPEENYLFEIALSRLQSKYSQTLKNGLTEREEMLLKEYLMVYLPNAGFEINRTFRYSSSEKAEAKLVATQDWNPGDQIKACTGVIAELSREDELALKNRDFSVMYSTKKKCMCLFLGPARFVNHDCQANTKFINMNTNIVSFKVVKPIKVGEEITTFYSANYFGVNNQECLCVTCEKFQRNGFAGKDLIADSEIENFGEGALLGSVKARAATARAANFNYYDIPNFGEHLKIRKKELEDLRRMTRCICCHTPHSEMGSSAGSDTSLDPCVRCVRHLLIFNMPFPSRKPITKMRHNGEICFEIYTSMLAIRKQLKLLKLSNGVKRFDITKLFKFEDRYSTFESDEDSDEDIEEIVPIDPGPDFPDSIEFAKKLVVIHLGDGGAFWPAISIPKDEVDVSIFKNVDEDEEVIRYFEDHSFLKVQKEDTIFRNIQAEDPRFLEQDDKPMRLAKEFLVTGVVSGKMRWKAWRERDLARQNRIKELERERLLEMNNRYMKKAKKSARKENLDKRKPPRIYRKKQTAETDVADQSFAPPSSAKSSIRFRPGNDFSDSRKFKQSDPESSFKKFASLKLSNLGSNIRNKSKNGNILSFFSRIAKESDDDKMEISDPLLNPILTSPNSRKSQNSLSAALIILDKEYISCSNEIKTMNNQVNDEKAIDLYNEVSTEKLEADIKSKSSRKKRKSNTNVEEYMLNSNEISASKEEVQVDDKAKSRSAKNTRKRKPETEDMHETATIDDDKNLAAEQSDSDFKNPLVKRKKLPKVKKRTSTSAVDDYYYQLDKAFYLEDQTRRSGRRRSKPNWLQGEDCTAALDLDLELAASSRMHKRRSLPNLEHNIDHESQEKDSVNNSIEQDSSSVVTSRPQMSEITLSETALVDQVQTVDKMDICTNNELESLSKPCNDSESKAVDIMSDAKKKSTMKPCKYAFNESDRKMQQKDIMSFFKPFSATTGNGPDILPDIANYGKIQKSPIIIMDQKSVDKLLTKNCVEYSMNRVIQKFFDDNGLNISNQRKMGKSSNDQENSLQSLSDEANSSVLKSPVKTPILSSRKNPNRRVSVPDFLDRSSVDDSEP